MDRIDTRYEIAEGADVYGADGGKVGSIVAVQPSYVIVEKGFFFPTDYYVPTSAIASVEDNKVYLSVTKEQALDEGWDAAPPATEAGAATDVVTLGSADDLSRTERAGWTEADAPFDHMADNRRTHVDDPNKIRVPVREEELTATTRQREIGEVRVEKDVVAEERTLEVPVTEERVRVERRAVDRPADAADAEAFQEGVIEVPVRGEEVELRKRAHVAEEVEIGKEAVQRTEQVAGTVRREEVRVEESDVDAFAGDRRS